MDHLDSILHDYILKYYGIDWIAFVLGLLGLYKIGNRDKIGFVFMAGSNVFWLIFSLMADSSASTIANLVVFVMNFRGYIKWRREEKLIAITPTPPPAPEAEPVTSTQSAAL